MRTIIRVGLVSIALCLSAFVASSEVSASAIADKARLQATVLSLLDERLSLMPDVAAAKWVAHLPVTDSVREAAVIAEAGQKAAAMGLDRASVEALIASQISHAREIQSALMQHWSQTGDGPVVAPRSLRDDLRPRIDNLSQALLRALYLAAPDLHADDLNRQVALLPDSRWTSAQREELLTQLQAIRYEAPRSVQRAQSAGVLRIGLPADYAPFALTTSEGVVGADVVLTRQLSAELSLQPVFVRTTWRTLMDDLDADRFDVAAGGISVTGARLARAYFSRPLIRGGKTAIGRCADKSRFSTLEQVDRDGVAVIENPGGTNEAFARGHLHHATLIIHPDNVTVMGEILAHRADVMFTDDIEIARVTRHEAGLCRLFDDLFDPADKALLLPRSGQWADTVNPALERVLGEQPYAGLLDDALQ